MRTLRAGVSVPSTSKSAMMRGFVATMLLGEVAFGRADWK